jgi:penicillin-binding protein 1A
MDETQQSRGEYFRYRIRRDATGALDWFRENWRARRRFRWLASAVGALLALMIVGWAVISAGLPDANKLLTYEPPLPTVVRGYDGEIVHSYAREHRVQLQFQDFPTQLINAYTSAEDKTFWTHGGVDIGGLIGAVFDYATKIGSGERGQARGKPPEAPAPAPVAAKPVERPGGVPTNAIAEIIAARWLGLVHRAGP